MDIFFLILGPGSLFGFIFGAVIENFLTYQFDLRYYLLGKGRVFNIDPNQLNKLHKTCFASLPNPLDHPQMVRLPLGLGFARLLIFGQKAEIKMGFYFWLAQSFIIFTALLNYQQGSTENLFPFIAGCEFLFGGFHLQSYLKLRRLQESLTLKEAR